MALFGKKKEEEFEEIEESPRQIKNLKPRTQKKEKTPPKPWGKKERYIVLSIFIGTILIAGILATAARGFKLPGLPKLSFSGFNFNSPFGEEVITLGKKDATKNTKEIIIKSNFVEMTDKLSGNYALYVIDLNNNNSFGVNQNEVMQAASLIKLPVMLYALDKVDYSKILAMGKKSDNQVFLEMLNKFGRDNLQNYIATLGMPNTSIAENTTTPKEIGDLLKTIYEEQNDKLLDSITDTIYEDWLSKGVSDGVRVAHKYGREVHVVNDAGVVYADRPYIVVIMTEDIVEKEADSIFPEISKMVYDNMIK